MCFLSRHPERVLKSRGSLAHYSPVVPVSQPAGTKRWMHGCTAPILFCTGTPSRPLCDLVILHFGFELDRAA